MLNSTGHTSSIDWWELGIFIHEMVFGTTPFGRTSASRPSQHRPPAPGLSVDAAGERRAEGSAAAVAPARSQRQVGDAGRRGGGQGASVLSERGLEAAAGGAKAPLAEKIARRMLRASGAAVAALDGGEDEMFQMRRRNVSRMDVEQ